METLDVLIKALVAHTAPALIALYGVGVESAGQCLVELRLVITTGTTRP